MTPFHPASHIYEVSLSGNFDSVIVFYAVWIQLIQLNDMLVLIFKYMYIVYIYILTAEPINVCLH